MYKKTLLSLAIASTITLTGCLENDKKEDENIGKETNGLTQEQITALEEAAGTFPIWNPAISALPIPNDLIFDSVAADGSFSVPNTSPPVTAALNSLSGASTVAPIDIKMSALIDSSSLNGDTYVAPSTPNPLQNVFLLELDYASGSPLQGLSAQEPPTLAPQTGLTDGRNDYTVSEIILDGVSYIRINPKKPLKPNTRYIVAVTNEIKDDTVDNAPIQASPSYKNITGSDALLSDALIKVRALTNGLWEKVSVGYFDAATNLVRASLGLPALTEDNIALSYSFTTSGDEKVLNYIADPAQWFDDQITTFVGVSTAKAMIAGQTDLNSDGIFDYTDVSLAVNGSLTAFPVNPSDPTDTTISDALAPIAAAFAHPNLASTGCASVTSGPSYISCVGIVLASFPSTAGGFSDLLPTPASTTSVTFDDANALDIYQVSSLTASVMQGAGVPTGTVSVVEGEITIPYYLAMPSGANATPLITDSWVADDTLATAINTAFAPLGLVIPQADPSVSTVVNYIFPFPKKTADVTIPVLGIFPTNPAGTMKTVIYQHGVQIDRSQALAFGSSMVAGAKLANNGVDANGFDVGMIAIDLPLHGIDGISAAEQSTLATQLLTVAGAIDPTDGLDATEQGTIDAVVAGLFSSALVQNIDLATNSGAPGSTACVDLGTNGLTATTNSILGGVCDADPIVDGALGQDASAAVFGAQVLERTIANGASQIPGLAHNPDTERHFGFTGPVPGSAPLEMDYTGSGATNKSGNMFINLTSFLTTRDNGRQAVLDLLTLRKSVGNMDLNGSGTDLDPDDVYYIAQSMGTLIGIPFVAVANDSASTSDDIKATIMQVPGAGASRLLENSPLFGPPAVGALAAQGITQDTANFQTFMNVFQAALDSADPINFASDYSAAALNIPLLIQEVIGDTVIPNSLDEASEVLGNGSISFLSGTEPLAVETDATSLTTASTGALGQNIVRFTEGTHGTPIFPSTGTTEEKDAFAEMVSQATSIVLSGGTAVKVTDTTVIQTP
jgi:hypothetical protein